MIVSQNLVGLFVIVGTHVADHPFKIFICLVDVESVPYGIKAHPDDFIQIVFIDPVDPFIFKYTDNLHVHLCIGKLPLIDVAGASAHTDNALFNPVGKLFSFTGLEDFFKRGTFQKFPKLIDFPDIPVGNFFYSNGFIIVRTISPSECKDLSAVRIGLRLI